MSSFLSNCPQCGCTFAAGSPCPSCRWVDSSGIVAVHDGEYCEEFAVRSRKQKSNTTLHMILMASTGFIGFGTAAMWIMFIFRGSILAFISIGFLTLVSGVMGLCTYLAKSRYPTSLLCPGCDSDVSDLGMEFNDCPACGVNLVAREGDRVVQAEVVDVAENWQQEDEDPAVQQEPVGV